MTQAAGSGAALLYRYCMNTCDRTFYVLPDYLTLALRKELIEKKIDLLTVVPGQPVSFDTGFCHGISNDLFKR